MIDFSIKISTTIVEFPVDTFMKEIKLLPTAKYEFEFRDKKILMAFFSDYQDSDASIRSNMFLKEKSCTNRIPSIET